MLASSHKGRYNASYNGHALAYWQRADSDAVDPGFDGGTLFQDEIIGNVLERNIFTDFAAVDEEHAPLTGHGIGTIPRDAPDGWR